MIDILKKAGAALLRFTCPTSQIRYESRKKSYIRSKLLSAIFTHRRELYLDPLADSRRAR